MPDPALRFAVAPDQGGAFRRRMRALRVLVLAPQEALAILRARLAGKRVRGRQALAALVGLDHHGLWREARAQARLTAPGGEPSQRGLAVEADLRFPGDLHRPGTAPVVVLSAPGHTLLPGAVAQVCVAFDRHPHFQALYGDALLIRADGAAMPLLRPAFDPDYLMAVDYIGPVIAFRRSALDALGSETKSPAESRATDLALQRTGNAAVDVVAEPNGVLTLRRPLPLEHPLVSLIVPTRDRLDLLRPCIASLLGRTDWPAREILICDNDSREPETRAYLRDLEARGLARIVPCPGPFDFAGMNNAAARLARGHVLAFVNNDVEAKAPDWLERLVREALRPEVGAVGAKLVDGRARIQHGGVLLGPGGLVTHAHRFFPGDAPGYLAGLRATRAVSAVTAACLVVEARKFAQVGGFDAQTFAVDFNDVDLCLRLGQEGYRTLFVPGAVLDHFEAASRRWTPEARARHLREVAAFQKRWGPLLAQDPHYHPGFDPDLGTYARLRPDWPGAGPIALR
jgi:GT2 family glycosyltransferase